MSVFERRIGAGWAARIASAAVATSCFAMHVPAGAAMIEGTPIFESVMIKNYYNFSFGQAVRDSDFGVAIGDLIKTDQLNPSLRLGDVSEGGFVSEIGFDITSSVGDDGAFSFLQNAYCVGTCMVKLRTEVIFTLTNTSGEAVNNLRFDSQITPGHLAQANKMDGNSAAGFTFGVAQVDAAGASFEHYRSIGGASNFASPGLRPDFFNGSTFNSNGDLWRALDWSATNLGIDLLEIGAGETQQFIYVSEVDARSISECIDLASCEGVQVAFGDPRNTGGGAESLRGLSSDIFSQASFDASDFEQGSLQPVIGRRFDAYSSYARVVTDDTQLPDDPEILPPVTYGAPFESQVAVPEPASWAMMVAGFAFIGGTLRRTGREADPIAAAATA